MPLLTLYIMLGIDPINEIQSHKVKKTHSSTISILSEQCIYIVSYPFCIYFDFMCQKSRARD